MRAAAKLRSRFDPKGESAGRRLCPPSVCRLFINASFECGKLSANSCLLGHADLTLDPCLAVLLQHLPLFASAVGRAVDLENIASQAARGNRNGLAFDELLGNEYIRNYGQRPEEPRMVNIPGVGSYFGTMSEIQQMLGGAKPQGQSYDPNEWEDYDGGPTQPASGGF